MPAPSPADLAAVALAQAVGAHALQAFAALLALLLLGAGLLAASMRRFERRRRSRSAHPVAQLALRLGIGFAAIVGAGLVFAAIAGEIGPGDSLARIDHAFSAAVHQSTPEGALRVFALVTHLGDPLALTFVCMAGTLALLARGERLLGWAFAGAIGGNALLNPALKRVFERVRPLGDGGLPLADGWSFPSGHSSGALVAYGMLAYVLLRTLPRDWHLGAVLLACAAAFSVGASRVFLQVHFASDVVAGFASGTAWLATCILSVEWVRGARSRDHAPGGMRSS